MQAWSSLKAGESMKKKMGLWAALVAVIIVAAVAIYGFTRPQISLLDYRYDEVVASFTQDPVSAMDVSGDQLMAVSVNDLKGFQDESMVETSLPDDAYVVWRFAGRNTLMDVLYDGTTYYLGTYSFKQNGSNDGVYTPLDHDYEYVYTSDTLQDYMQEATTS